jgi:cyclin H
MKPLRKKLQKCRDPDRVDLVALQRARREQGTHKEKKLGAGLGNNNSDDVFGSSEGGNRDTKRRKVDSKLDDPFGGPL